MREFMQFFRPGTGTEARMARSAYRLRLILSALALPIGVAAGVWLIQGADNGPWDATGIRVAGAICVAVALAAAIDIVVILRRRREGGQRA
ncbi:MAG: hypothetical protein GEV03_21405 [Streptosporangiales bacterium]|nr:hypothetical protein [Streptosporangiales bacterium]